MALRERTVVVTGAASGIGAAMAAPFVGEGARAVVLADRDAARRRAVAGEVGGSAVGCDVTVESQLRSLVARVAQAFGRVDVFCASAGACCPGDEHAPVTNGRRTGTCT